MIPQYFEEFEVGQTFDLGSATVTKDEIVAFGRQFDPQPFHIDEQAAEHSMYGGLIASGWHTTAILMRLLVDGLLNSTASMGSPGVDELRWLRPVRPGDTLRARLTIVETTPSKSRLDRGTIRSTCQVLNQRDEVVMRVTAANIIGRRPSASGPAGEG